MKAKDYLLQIRILDTRLKNIEAEIREISEQSASLRSAWPDGLPHGSGTSDPTAAKAIKLADRLQELQYQQIEVRSQLWHKRAEIVKVIGMVEDADCERLLYLRYVDCRQWEEIEDDVHISRAHLFRKHDEALGIVEDLLKYKNEIE